jgi:tetratricopeptide (TPR) repeat protein
MSEDIEARDAKAVDAAIAALTRGRIDEAERALLAVVKNTPPDYAYACEREGRRFVKFWSMAEFLHGVARLKARGDAIGLTWVSNAYGRAHYYLGYIEVHRKRPERAVRWLDAGLKLEPSSAHFRLEKAQALSILGDVAGALRLYEEVLAMGEDVPPPDRAMALRGKAVKLIDLGALDDAEGCLLESLKLDPKSPVARNELTYIRDLRGGAPQAPLETVVRGEKPTCEKCGKPIQRVGRTIKEATRTRYFCERCSPQV